MAQTEQFLILLLLLLSPLLPLPIKAFSFNFSRNSHLAGIIFPTPLSLNSASSPSDSNCRTPLPLPLPADSDPPLAGNTPPVKLHLKHHRPAPDQTKISTLSHSKQKDSLRIQSLFRRATQNHNHNQNQNKNQHNSPVINSPSPPLDGLLSATVESGVALGSGEYFIDVFIGTPNQHFSLILDTGSDLNWLQCLPCHSCFDQTGPIFDPSSSSSYRNLTCSDPRCSLVSHPDTSPPCSIDPSSSCPYFYWYGDRSNTTGDLATEIFTVNLTDTLGSSTPSTRRVEGVIFGCGHWNRGLFHGAAGLLGLGRGPLSFASQLRSLYGHTFSYCLVDRNSDLTVSSKLVFGEDPSLLAHPHLNFTSFSTGRDNPADTFYYLHVRGVSVGGEMLDIPMEAWEVSESGAGGTIIDSGTTLSYFSDGAYAVIREAFERKVPYKLFEEFPVLRPCYNVSGIEKVKMPEFSIVFADGAVWDFPAENYFIRLEPESIMCLAILGTPKASLSILGNYLQQNFHIMYDTKNSRLGFAPMKCAEEV